MNAPQTEPQSIDVDGHYRALIGKRAIGAVDLSPGEERAVTITRVTQEDVVDMSLSSKELDRRQKAGESIMIRKLAIHINGTERFIVINGERGEDLARLYGPKVREWKDKRVTLYRVEKRTPQGVGVLRIKGAAQQPEIKA